MTAKEYLETKARMTKKCEICCDDCPLNNVHKESCYTLECKHCDEAIAIVKKWGEKHRVKTLLDVFFEIFPNTTKGKDELPEHFCPRQFGYNDYGCRCSDKCVECWSQPYEEVEK